MTRARLLCLLFVMTAGCTPVTFHPRVRERTSADPRYLQNYTVAFEVVCDSCLVHYGKTGATSVGVAEGDWMGSIQLGTLRDDARVQVRLRVRPFGEARVLQARILVNGREVRSGDSDEPGKTVTLITRVP